MYVEYLTPMIVSFSLIKPVGGKGFAGGEKFEAHGIMFKFCVDSARLFDDDESAHKIGGERACTTTIYLTNIW